MRAFTVIIRALQDLKLELDYSRNAFSSVDLDLPVKRRAHFTKTNPLRSVHDLHYILHKFVKHKSLQILYVL